MQEIARSVGDRTEPCIAIKCAFIRAFLIERYGGIYVDSDCIVLKDLGTVFDDLAKWDFVAMRRTSAPKRHVSIGFYGSRPGGTIISLYADRLRAMLSERTAFAWGDAGAWALTPVVNEHEEQCLLYPEERVHPIVAEKQHAYLMPSREIAAYLQADPLTFMLYHRLFERDELADASEDDLLTGDTILSEAFRIAQAGGQWRADRVGRRVLGRLKSALGR